MSAEAETWVLRLCEDKDELRPIHCHVLQLLAIRHDRDYRIAWPSVEGMSRESHYTPRAIFKALDELTTMRVLHRDYGELPRKRRGDRMKLGNRYRFPGLDDIPEDEHPRLIGGRRSPASPDQADEPHSSEPGDVHMNGQMNLTQVPDEPGDAVQMNRAGEPDAPGTRSTKRAVKNGQLNGHTERAHTHASTDEAEDDGEPPARQPIQPIESTCPLAPHTYVGSYQDHLASDPRHMIARPPPRRRATARESPDDERPAAAEAG